MASTTNAQASQKTPKSQPSTRIGKRKFLTQEQLQMTCTELMDHLVCSKATAWRALRNGFYCPSYNGSIKQRASQRAAKSKLKPLKVRPASGKKVRLSKTERQLSRNELAKRYHIGHALATQALKTGYFTMPVKRFK